MIILGIDPGFAIVGYGIIEKTGNSLAPIDYGVIKTTPNDSFPLRLFQIENATEQLIHKYKPDEIAVEELFFAKNVKTALLHFIDKGLLKEPHWYKNLSIVKFAPNLSIVTGSLYCLQLCKKLLKFVAFEGSIVSDLSEVPPHMNASSDVGLYCP